MRVYISSNVVSGIYTGTNVLLVVFLTKLLEILARRWNLQQLRDDRSRTVRLKPSPFTCVQDLGLTSNRMHRVCLAVSGTVVALMAGGQFSIVGETVSSFEDFPVKNLVTTSLPGNPLDLTNHISLEERLVSGTVLLLRQFFLCSSQNNTHLVFFQYTNSEDNLMEPKWHVSDKLRKSTCLIQEEGFMTKTSFELEDIPPPAEYLSRDCEWYVNSSGFQNNVVMQTSVVQNASCPFPVTEAWCFQKEELMCAALSAVPNGLAPSIFVKRNAYEQLLRHRFSPSTKSLNNSAILKSMMYLLAVGFPPSPEYVFLLSRLTLEFNVKVKRRVKSVEVTDVNLIMFCLTSGFASLIVTGITVITLLTGCPRNIQTSTSNPRNPLNTMQDVIFFAQSVLSDELLEDSCDECLFIGVSRMKAIVGPLRRADSTAGTVFREEKLVGRQLQI